MPAIFARNFDFIGQVVCEDAHLAADEQNRGQDGWDIGINYDTLGDLFSQLTTQCGGYHISILGIGCHGSMQGAEPATFGGAAIEGRSRTWLRADNIPSFQSNLNSIGSLLEPNGVVYLFSCSLGISGRPLLMRLSEIWRGRRVVGFEGEGYLNSNQSRTGQHCQLPGVMFEGHWGDWGNRSAVSARNGAIIRY